ncbi:transposase [Botrimarina mediterranea]|uniref:Insertion element IS402-like domain-containing protein n=1 Tax=Botrimarina mediterranea TaxID=2528022 RepID=A0A518K264_9BACT|nr:transposase [Botrimarina mediterranea]QDV71904.1 hypothetical protein Spa11_00730 [Botrimarina mediterranea]
MVASRMPEEFFVELKAHLPPVLRAGPRGGRPRVAHRTVMKVLWWVLATGSRWEEVPPVMGCSGRTAHRSLRAWEELGVWDRLHMYLLRRLRKAGELEHATVVVDSVTVRAFGGGDRSGPSLVDRRKPSSRQTLLANGNGMPLAIRTAEASRNRGDGPRRCRELLGAKVTTIPDAVEAPGDHTAESTTSGDCLNCQSKRQRSIELQPAHGVPTRLALSIRRRDQLPIHVIGVAMRDNLVAIRGVIALLRTDTRRLFETRSREYGLAPELDSTPKETLNALSNPSLSSAPTGLRGNTIPTGRRPLGLLQRVVFEAPSRDINWHPLRGHFRYNRKRYDK